MIVDKVWQQFLLFCNRNGLYYGEKPDDESLLCWNDKCKVVRSFNSQAATTATAHPFGVTNDDTNWMMVSTLERLLRR
jgi:hypothetical protein